MPTDTAPVSVWTCDFCGVDVHVSDRCSNCGGEHAAPAVAPAEVVSQPSSQLHTGHALFGLFLLLGGFAFGLQTERILSRVAHCRWSQQHALQSVARTPSRAAKVARPTHSATQTKPTAR